MLKALLLSVLLLASAACSPPSGAAQTSGADASKSGASASAAAAQPVPARGTVTAVNTATGKITIAHEPIPAIDWSAMTMEFTAENPSILQGVAVGDHIAFELKSRAETGIIIAVRKQ